MRVTLKEIAKQANVSRMTVSRVFSGSHKVSQEKQELIKRIASEMGYHPDLIARSLSCRKSMTIGVFMPKTKNAFLDIYIAQILSGITDVLQDNDYRIMFFPFNYNESQEDLYYSIANSRLVDGIILLKTRIDDPGIARLAKSDFPFVLINHKKYADKYNFVDARNVEGSILAIEHFYRLGHRKVAFIAGTMNETNAIDRFRGYKDALKEFGLPYKKEWIINGEFSKDRAFQESAKLFELKSRPTAVFCSDDYMAIGLMEQLKLRGMRVPEDVSVIGFDDIELASYVKPALTTISQPMYQIGKRSAELLFDLINGTKKPPVYELLDVKLVVRDSTAGISKK